MTLTPGPYAAPRPANEAMRLRALHEAQVLDTAPESAYEALTQLASRLLDMPIALVSLVDADRQWFKSVLGLGLRETPRDIAFCAHALLEPGRVFEVTDAHRDPRFADNPLVTGDAAVRYYAGMPVVTGDGFALGTLCVFDRRPRILSREQLETLRQLGVVAAELLDSRRTGATAPANGAWLSQLSHEIRTPMNAIIGMADILLDSRLTPEQRDSAETIRASSEQLLNDLDKLPGFPKIESGWLRKPESAPASFQWPHRLGEEHPLRILVAEDSAVNQKVIQRLLERLGYQPDFANDGAAAVETVLRQPYDLVLMDLHMPVMDGLTAGRTIFLQMPADNRPVVVALTANGTPADRQACADVGMDAYLLKPVRPEQLVDILRAVPRRQSFQHDFSSEALGSLEKSLGEEGMREVITALVSDFEQQKAQLLTALADDDRRVIVRNVHTLKGTSRMLYAHALGHAFAEIEAALGREKFVVDAPLLQSLVQRYQRLLDQVVEALLKSRP